MKFANLYFLSKSYIKGNKNSGVITLLICLLTVAVTVVSCLTITTVRAVNRYKEDYKARALSIAPCLGAFDDGMVEAISSVEHVVAVADTAGIPWYWPFSVVETNAPFIAGEIKSRDTHLYIQGLYEGEEKSVVKGKTLDESPAFSCLVPSVFYPFEMNGQSENLDYIDGTTLIGKSITLKGHNERIEFNYFIGDDSYCDQVNTSLSSPEFTLNIVGTYPCTYATSGNALSIYISRETNLILMQRAIEETGIDLSTDENSVAKWWNTPSLHEYLIVVDDYDNITEVYNTVKKDMGYKAVSSVVELPPDDVTMLMATVFSTVGTFLTAAIAFIAVFLLVQSSVNSIRARKGFIGLMKAIGYKNHQIFTSLIYEQLYMSLRAFLIGGVISTIIVFFANLKFEHGTYHQMQYIIDWRIFGVFLIISFLIALLVPLITQLLLLMKLTKIEPREAMNAK